MKRPDGPSGFFQPCFLWFWDGGDKKSHFPKVLFFFLICTYFVRRNMVGIWLQIRLVFPQVLFFPVPQFLFYACEDLVDITWCSWPFAYSRNGHDGAEEMSAVQGVWQKHSPTAALSESPSSTPCSATDFLGDHEKVTQFWQLPHWWHVVHGLALPHRGVVRT